MARKSKKAEEAVEVEAEVVEEVVAEDERPFVSVDSHTVARRGVEDPQAERR